jgi:2'-5' RNA ligase
MQKHYFIAVSLPPAVKQILADWKKQMEPLLPFQSWVHHEDYHITLAFLGSVDLALPSLQKEMERLSSHPSFSLVLQGLKTFGAPEKPRILWADVTHAPELFALQSEVIHMCERLGFSLDKRPYRPHITLARRWRGEHLFQEPSKLWEPVVFSAASVVLYQTNLNRVPKYEELYKVSLL